jgi:hypothetical protein
MGAGAGARAGVSIVIDPRASALETLAAREVRRYFYLRTGELPKVVAGVIPAGGEVIVVARADRPLAAGAAAGPLLAQQYAIRSGGSRAWLVGGDDVGTLYAAYRFVERLGVRFYLHGDVVPDGRIAPALPQWVENGKPLFEVRGLLPFHDFPEGPDWWNRDDYLAAIAQLPKLRMNFIGFHTYPEEEVGPEPGVWIGLPADANPDGTVSFSYPAQWASTARNGPWSFTAMKTSDFTGGASLLFERDNFAPDVMGGSVPSPRTPGESNEVFNRTGELFRDAFAEAKLLGVRTCIGTETPLTIPALVKERLVRQKRDPKDPAVVRDLYEGMFRRIAAACPVDNYWLWTPESWTWENNKPGQFQATTRDIQSALDALTALGKPFTLATCGWVLGPREDRTALDRFLPKDSPMSCINRKVGHAPDEPGFANLTGRPKWVIPWLENDPSLVAPEPWVGRMRVDAAEARRLGCTGLIGIHWRTKAIAGNIAALAAAGWEQPWLPPGFDPSPIKPGTAAPDLAADTGDLEHPRKGRTVPVGDFYTDFARASFGDAVAEAAGAVLAGVDGVRLPEPAKWIKGPGDIKVETRPWSQVRADYGFVERLAALRARVAGAGNLERFDYWLDTYRYMAALAETACLRGELDREMAALAAERDPLRRRTLAEGALRVRLGLARSWERMMGFQVAAADTPGELGTLANLEQHSRVNMEFISTHDAALAKALGRALPTSVEPSRDYAGPPRLFVSTVRTLAGKGESLSLRIVILGGGPAVRATLCCRKMGTGAYRQLPVSHVARAIYAAVLPPVGQDLEYYVRAETAGGTELVWPRTAPLLAQTVVGR